jgi:hypothetical protein
MSALAQSFRDMLAKHDLTSASISVYEHGFTAYVHWEGRGCASVHGSSPDEAFASALSAAHGLRNPADFAPNLADEPVFRSEVA